MEQNTIKTIIFIGTFLRFRISGKVVQGGNLQSFGIFTQKVFMKLPKDLELSQGNLLELLKPLYSLVGSEIWRPLVQNRN